MNSNNSISSFQNEGYFGTLILYAFIALLFFFLGRNFDRIKTEVKSRTVEKRGNKVTISLFSHFSLVFRVSEG